MEANERRTTVPAKTYDVLIEEARRMGEERGREVASWYFDGNTTTETYAAVLRGIEDGDPEILDTLPSSPLSGEWAGDPVPTDVLATLGVSHDSDAVDEYLDAYEMGFAMASQDQIEETARTMTREEN
jgi:hypothetical protein